MTKEPLWRWHDACAAVGAPLVEGPDIHGVSIDTRTLQPGDLFVALPGDPGPRFNTHHRSTRDGHDYVGDAAARGAPGALVSRPTGVDLPQIQVADTLDALWALGRAARTRLGGPVIALTGSSGKTTLKTLLSAALRCPASSASFNNFLGVPLSLARTPADAPVAVFEIGTNHPGEIGPLTQLVRPDVALVLNVMPVHIENFPDMAALTREKLSIAQGLVEGGTLVLLESLVQAPLADVGARTRVITFGESTAAHVQLLRFDAGDRRAIVRWTLPSGTPPGRGSNTTGTMSAQVPGGGRHRAMTLTATIACLLAAGFDPALAAALGDELVPAGRGRIHDIAGVAVIDDSYNANPASTAFALRELAAMAQARGGRAFAILGEMLELGDASPDFHRGLASDCVDIHGVLCVGEGARVLHEALPVAQRLGFATAAADIDLEQLGASLRAGDAVLIKGSNRVFWAHDFVQRALNAWTANADPA
jgi:UDP-N-acetylmuramoyl-tripeptide--D-alanyl-D-alanine ligase